jgi:hypothetical protein
MTPGPENDMIDPHLALASASADVVARRWLVDDGR